MQNRGIYGGPWQHPQSYRPTYVDPGRGTFGDLSDVMNRLRGGLSSILSSKIPAKATTNASVEQEPVCSYDAARTRAHWAC